MLVKNVEKSLDILNVKNNAKISRIIAKITLFVV